MNMNHRERKITLQEFNEVKRQLSIFGRLVEAREELVAEDSNDAAKYIFDALGLDYTDFEARLQGSILQENLEG